jgi:hypothetical protein
MPFTTDQFIDVFRRYNTAVWPAQWLLLSLGIVAVVLALRSRQPSGRWVSVILAGLWLWMALVYHLAFFASINGLAIAFAAAFALQSGLFLLLAVRAEPVSYVPRSRLTIDMGALLVLYAIAAYPAIGVLAGHRYPDAPSFGVPCPTTIFTLGLMVWAASSIPWWAMVIPVAWAVVGMSAALNLGMIEDLGLPVAGILTVGSVLIVRRRRTTSRGSGSVDSLQRA